MFIKDSVTADADRLIKDVEKLLLVFANIHRYKLYADVIQCRRVNLQWIHFQILVYLLRWTYHKTDTSLRWTHSHVLAERRCLSHRKTSIIISIFSTFHWYVIKNINIYLQFQSQVILVTEMEIFSILNIKYLTIPIGDCLQCKFEKFQPWIS